MVSPSGRELFEARHRAGTAPAAGPADSDTTDPDAPPYIPSASRGALLFRARQGDQDALADLDRLDGIAAALTAAATDPNA